MDIDNTIVTHKRRIKQEIFVLFDEKEKIICRNSFFYPVHYSKQILYRIRFEYAPVCFDRGAVGIVVFVDIHEEIRFHQNLIIYIVYRVVGVMVRDEEADSVRHFFVIAEPRQHFSCYIGAELLLMLSEKVAVFGFARLYAYIVYDSGGF